MYYKKWKVTITQKLLILKIVRKCYFFDDVIKIENLDFHDILINDKSYENDFVYNS